MQSFLEMEIALMKRDQLSLFGLPPALFCLLRSQSHYGRGVEGSRGHFLPTFRSL